MRRELFLLFALAIISVISIYSEVLLLKGYICSYTFLIPYLAPLAFVLGFASGFFWKEEKKPKLSRFFEGDERLTLEIAERKGTQAELSARIGKVRAARVIARLERRGLIKRIKRGRTFKLIATYLS